MKLLNESLDLLTIRTSSHVETAATVTMTSRLINHGRRYMKLGTRSRRSAPIERKAANDNFSSTSGQASTTSKHYGTPLQTTDYYATNSVERTLNQVLETQRLSNRGSEPDYESAVRSIVKF